MVIEAHAIALSNSDVNSRFFLRCVMNSQNIDLGMRQTPLARMENEAVSSEVKKCHGLFQDLI